MSKITPHLWFASGAEEAVRFYVTLVPDSRIDHIAKMPAGSPSGLPGSVTMIDFTLAGQSYMALEAGPFDPFNHAVSFMIHCADQAEVDRIWDAIVAHRGTPERCGWIRDTWGLCWQIVPSVLGEMMGSDDPGASARAAQAMMTMVKLDVAALQRAYEGEGR